MRIATGGDMLNFGLWDENNKNPVAAQRNLCTVFGEMAQLKSGQRIVDVGGGYSTPAALWCERYFPADVACVDLNFGQLRDSGIGERPEQVRNGVTRINATARILPFVDESLDRVLALESPQHFRPLEDFLSESFRVLKKDGMLALAIPVVKKPTSIIQLGVLAMAWSSEHYTVDFVKAAISVAGFSIVSLQSIGSKVYDPLSDYYVENRNTLRPKILRHYPSYVEKILYNSVKKMKSVSQGGMIDYLLILCKK